MRPGRERERYEDEFIDELVSGRRMQEAAEVVASLQGRLNMVNTQLRQNAEKHAAGRLGWTEERYLDWRHRAEMGVAIIEAQLLKLRALLADEDDDEALDLLARIVDADGPAEIDALRDDARCLLEAIGYWDDEA